MHSSVGGSGGEGSSGEGGSSSRGSDTAVSTISQSGSTMNIQAKKDTVLQLKERVD